MIYTVTFNPSIDYIVNVDNFMTGVVNRYHKEIIFPGGKGINVSMVLKNLGGRKHRTWIYGRIYRRCHHTGFFRRRGVAAGFSSTATEGLSRINGKLRAQTETEINGQVPKDCIRRYPEATRKTGCIAGWRYTGTPEASRMDIMEHLQNKKLNIVVVDQRTLLMNVLAYHPFLIKPNNKLGIFSTQ